MTSYTGNGGTTTLEATGTGSTLTLANLATVTETANNYQAQTQFEALAGGTVTLSALKTINTGTVVLEGDGTNSVLERVGPDRLRRGQRLDLLDAPGLQRRHGQRRQPGQPVQREPEHRRHRARTLTLSSLTSFSSGNITVSGGATLSLPGVTGYTGNGGTTTLEATGTGSTLTLANLATVTESCQQLPGPDQVRGPGRRHGDPLGAQDHQHRHGGPGGRRHQQRARTCRP